MRVYPPSIASSPVRLHTPNIHRQVTMHLAPLTPVEKQKPKRLTKYVILRLQLLIAQAISHYRETSQYIIGPLSFHLPVRIPPCTPAKAAPPPPTITPPTASSEPSSEESPARRMSSSGHSKGRRFKAEIHSRRRFSHSAGGGGDRKNAGGGGGGGGTEERFAS